MTRMYINFASSIIEVASILTDANASVVGDKIKTKRNDSDNRSSHNLGGSYRQVCNRKDVVTSILIIKLTQSNA